MNRITEMAMYTRDGVIAVVFQYPVHLRQPKRNVNQEKGLRVQAFGLCRLIEARYVMALVPSLEDPCPMKH
jgi:hypothetical protein